MISVEEALEMVNAQSLQLGSEYIPLDRSGGRFLAKDILSPLDHPLFDQSAMDGYAVKLSDVERGNKIRLRGETAAGDPRLPLNSGEAVRIFTGGAVPEGADAVLIQERVTMDGEVLVVETHPLKSGMNIRYKGEQIKQGGVALNKGHQLNSGSIGFLASLGFDEAEVVPKPKVDIIVTGNEFAEKPEDIHLGKIFESNGVMLESALRSLAVCSSAVCKDDLESLKVQIIQSMETCDLLILTGGVSVGDYDYTRQALEECGFEIQFHKVAQKPGKPMLMAKKKGKLAFGLPGNPRAALILAEVYVKPLLIRSQKGSPESFEVALESDFQIKGPRSLFMAGIEQNGVVSFANQQGSHMLKSIAESNVLVYLSVEKAIFKAGEFVPAYRINVR